MSVYLESGNVFYQHVTWMVMSFQESRKHCFKQMYERLGTRILGTLCKRV